MQPIRVTVTLVVALIAATAFPAARSGPLGIYGLIERVVFEPNATAPERVQLWGAFAYVNGVPGVRELAISAPRRGHLYFKLPDSSQRGMGAATAEDIQLVRREWADLASVAGTGQAVGFGGWGFAGAFELTPGFDPKVFDRSPTGEGRTVLVIRSEGEKPSQPIAYMTNAGVVRLAATGNRAELVAQLKASLAR